VNDERTELLRAKILVLATGAYEYVPPFPGWTLPGVMTPGAAQVLAKTMDVVPGKRILVAGTGPFLLVAASQLAERGANVVAVLEATPRSAWLSLPFKSPRTLDLIKEGLGYLRILKEKGVPVRYGRIVTSAEGAEDLTSVTHAPADRNWNPDRSREEIEEIDTLAIAYGFVPRIYLPQIAGCDVVFQPELGGWIPKRDRDMATTVRNVFAVGDGSGVAGSLTACLEGRLAGLVAAHRLGAIGEADTARRRQPIERELRRVGTLRRALDRISLIRPGLSTLITDETIVCRCEEVSWSEARQSIEYGGCDFRTLKVMTRLGMGTCQGRFCWPSMSRLVACHNQCSVDRVGPASPQSPVRPISLGALASMPVADDRIEP
jgi:NADPH-dependent 2,4-dienoyl-CoA reductase/sulfur reductase-like enzyme